MDESNNGCNTTGYLRQAFLGIEFRGGIGSASITGMSV